METKQRQPIIRHEGNWNFGGAVALVLPSRAAFPVYTRGCCVVLVYYTGFGDPDNCTTSAHLTLYIYLSNDLFKR
jgi:hypothetical protein